MKPQPEAQLPTLPKVEMKVLGEVTPDVSGFLRVRHLTLELTRPEGLSEPFGYDVLDRRALDASVVVAHHVHDGALHVWLRSCVRPPVALRPPHAAFGAHDGVLWEVPAGLIEPGESPAEAAARELDEELGFTVEAAHLEPLGPWTVPAPGFIGEVHAFFHVRVDPTARHAPRGDGSALESAPAVVAVPLEQAMRACRQGEIRDAKTELALRRLADEKVLRGVAAPG